MNAGLRAVLCGIVLAGMSWAAQAAELQGREDAAGKMVWYDGQALPIEGRAFTDTECFYDRLPARAQKTVPSSVWGLSRHSAGMAFRFVTDAPRLTVRWAVRNASLAMPHMPATGVSGVDIYQRTSQGWRFVRNGRPTAVTNSVDVSVTPNAECLIYLPLYNGTSMVEIGIPSGHKLSTPPPRANGQVRPIVFYGTSITHGGCASRPGMAFTAVAGRLVDAPVVNLGFSGSGKMESALCDLVAEIDASVYVLDCLWNMNDALVSERTEPFIRTLRDKRPDTPILLAEDCNVYGRAPTSKSKILRTIFDKLKAEDSAKWSRLHYLEAKEMLGHDGEGTVDGCHPNDLGMMRQGTVFGQALQKILAQ